MAARRMALAVRPITTTPMVRLPDCPTGLATRLITTMPMVHRRGHRTGRATRPTTIMQMGHLPDRLLRWAGSETLENGGDWQYPTNSLHKFFKVTVEMP